MVGALQAKNLGHQKHEKKHNKSVQPTTQPQALVDPPVEIDRVKRSINAEDEQSETENLDGELRKREQEIDDVEFKIHKRSTHQNGAAARQNDHSSGKIRVKGKGKGAQ